jgi:quercetin dioxygenase-like cupin family protein
MSGAGLSAIFTLPSNPFNDRKEAMMETVTFLGMENRVLLSAEDTEGVVGVIDISIQPGAGAPLHTNTREALLWYVIDGDLTVQTEEGPVLLAEGSATFLPKGTTHKFLNASEQTARALLVCMPGGLEGFVLELSGKLPADVPIGPPPAETMELLVGTAARYGQQIHLEESES